MKDKNDIVIINLDKPRVLWYGHKALKTLSALTGKKMAEIANMNNVDFEDIEKIIYCGLLTDARKNNETIRLEDMEDLLDKISFGELMDSMQRAIESSFGVTEQKKEVAAKKKKSSKK